MSWIKRLWKEKDEVNAASENNTEEGIQELFTRTAVIVDVTEFGAVGDGITDNTVAFENAISALKGKGGGTLQVPLGTWLVKEIAITVTGEAGAESPIVIEGEGRQATLIVKNISNTKPTIKVETTTAGHFIADSAIRHLTVYHNVGATKGPGIQMVRTAWFRIEDCEFINCKPGVEMQGAVSSIVDNCIVFTSNELGVVLTKDPKSELGCFAITLRKCVISNCKKVGVEADYCAGFIIDNCDIENNGEAGVLTTGGIIVGENVLTEPPGFGAGQVVMSRLWMENNKGRAITVKSGEIRLHDSMIFATDTGTTTTQGRDFLGANNINLKRVVISDCCFPTTVSATKQIAIEAGECRGEIANTLTNQLYEIPVWMIFKSDSIYTTPLRFGTSSLSNLTAFETVTAGLALTGASAANGSLIIHTVGAGLRVKEGSNAKQGISSAMVAGKVEIANTSVTANSRVFVSRAGENETHPGAVYVAKVEAGVKFVVKSTNAEDTDKVVFEIFEPGE